MSTVDCRPADVVAAMQALDASGLNTGSAGNASCRSATGSVWITPSGVPASALDESSIVELSMNGEPTSPGAIPSSEWRLHRDIYAARPDVHAIVHTHSSYATALACQRRDIPAFHYMVAVAGGDSIRCSGYATFGTQMLSDEAITALGERNACLLANHGVVALGSTPAKAVNLAIEVEQLARQYCIASSLAPPVILSREEMSEVLEKFKTYGQRID
jgi:L-fuculose-phosphate aldolase